MLLIIFSYGDVSIMNFEQVKIFVSVVENGGFRAASDALHRSQPAVSNAVKNLENQLGFQLFNRDDYRPTLTNQGKAFFTKAKLLVQQQLNLIEYSKILTDDLETSFTVAFDAITPFNPYIAMFHDILQLFPNTHFHFLSETLGGPSERLLHHEADIIIAENLISETPVEVIGLQTIQFIPVATPDFIDRHQQSLSEVDRLSETMQVIVRDSSRYRDKISFGVVPHAHHWTVSDIQSKKLVIQNGMGWGRLPRRFHEH